MIRQQMQNYPRDNKKEHFSLITYEKQGRHFELDVDPDKAIEYREKKLTDLDQVLKVYKVFENVRQDQLSTKDDMIAVFGTDDTEEVIKFMLENGELQLSQEHRKKIVEALHKRIVSEIYRMAIDARTDMPLPMPRIENGLEEAKFKVKENVSYDKLFKTAIDGLKRIIPIKIANIKYSILLDMKYSVHVLKYLETLGTVMKKEKQGSDKINFVIDMPSGLKQEFMENINNLTHGTAKIDLA